MERQLPPHLQLIAAASGVRIVGARDVWVGRDPVCDFVLDDPWISRRHLVLHPTVTGWTLQDRSHGRTYTESGAITGVALSSQPGSGMRLWLGSKKHSTELIVSTGSEDRQPKDGTPTPELPELRLFSAGTSHSADPLDDNRIGRDPSCDLVINGGSVSGVHATVHWTGGEWELSNDDSSSGCYVSGRRVDRLSLPVGVTEVQVGGPTAHTVIAAVQASGGRSERLQSQPAPGSVVLSRPLMSLLRIGRHPDNDLILNDLSVSRHHSVVRRFQDGWWVEDLGSSFGTFVNGQPVTAGPLHEGDLLALGRHILLLSGGQLIDHVDDRVSLMASSITVEVGGQRILDEVSLVVDAGQLVAVVGPTGAGKSTLVKALSGYSHPSSGAVFYNGQNLHASLGQLRSRIGYVPQDDICHVQLELRKALQYAAELRFPADTRQDERQTRIGEVLTELGLEHRADLRVDKLSGGQRKRCSIAMELLTRPALMFCDEPTSGLDPAYERSVTELLRGLADGGRTILVITHSVASLHLYDRVLCLAPGGRSAYYGPPQEALKYFGVADWPDVFALLEREQRDWTGDLNAHPLGDQYVAGPLKRWIGALSPTSENRSSEQTSLRLTWTLLRRSVAVALASRAYGLLLLAQAPLIGVILLAAVGRNTLDLSAGPRAENAKALLLLALLVVATVTIGLVNACRELVKERAVWQRERAVGLGVVPYLSAKALMATAIALIQIPLLCLIVVAPQKPGRGVLLPSGALEIGLVLFAVAVTASCLGLTISAIAHQEAVALVAVPVLIIAQMVLCGAFVKVDGRPALEQAAWSTTSYWGLNATGSTARVLQLDLRCARQLGVRGGPTSPTPCPGRAEHTVWDWAQNMAGVVAPIPILLLLAGLVLARRRPE
ncbi:MAG: FHA domain-containing protein [Nocardioidaceae bacterium]